MPELTGYFASLGEEPSPWLRPLVDIGNSWSMGQPPSDDDFATLGPMVDLIHLKDRDFEAKRTVPLGDGKVPWARGADAPAGPRRPRPRWSPAWRRTARRTAAMPQPNRWLP